MNAMIPFYNTSRSLNRTASNFFDDPFFGTFFDTRDFAGASVMRVDVQDTGDAYLMEVDLPGAKRDGIDISVDDDMLTITADMNAEKKEQKKNYVFHERRTGRFQRRFNLEGINRDGITAEFNDGILKLNMPKAAPPAGETPRKIEIQ